MRKSQCSGNICLKSSPLEKVTTLTESSCSQNFSISKLTCNSPTLFSINEIKTIQLFVLMDYPYFRSNKKSTRKESILQSWLPVRHRFELLIVCKSLSVLDPKYISKMFAHYQPETYPRSCGNGQLVMPRTVLKLVFSHYARTSFP